MLNFPDFSIDRRVLFFSIAILATGTLLGTCITTAVLLPRVYDAEAVTQSLKGMNSLQSGRIAELATRKAADLGPARSQPLPPISPQLVAVLPTTPTEAARTTAPDTAAVTPPTTRMALQPTARPVARPAPPARPTTPVIARPASPVQNLPATAGLNPSAQAALAIRGASPAVVAKDQIGAVATATVTLEQAGITGLDSNGVRFKSGRQVAIGAEFPSGEKLISVNPADGRIVTDRRVIVVAKPQLEK